MPHLRLEVPETWLSEEFVERTGFDACALLDHLVEVVCELRMPKVDAASTSEDDEPASSEQLVPMINRKNLKHALIPVRHSGVGGDRSKGFLHVTFAAGNDTPGRTARVRRTAAETLGNAVDLFVGHRLPDLASVTVHVKDIDRARGYSTTAERGRKREQEESPAV